MQRNIGVWLGLALIVVILGLDIVGGGKAELLGTCVARAWTRSAGRGGVGQLPGRRPGTPDLTEVAATLDCSVTRAIGPGDFVTAVVVRVVTDGSVIVLNCGHPPPLLVRAGRATRLDPPEPALPLGLDAPGGAAAAVGAGDWILLGEFNRSSQHPSTGGVDGTTTGLGCDGDRKAADAVAGPAAGSTT